MEKQNYEIVVIYVRLSDNDKGRNRVSLEEQIKQCQAFCKGRNLVVDKIFTETTTGESFDRPKWNELIDYIHSKKKGEYSMIVVSDWDRFIADFEVLFKTVNKLVPIKIHPVCVQAPHTCWSDDDRFDIYTRLLSSLMANEEI